MAAAVRGQVLAGLLLALVILAPSSAPAQSEALNQAFSRGLELYRAGRYADAEPFWQEMVRRAEREFGPGDAHLATGLDYLASLYRDWGRYAEAEPLYRRALELMEDALGPDHAFVGPLLNNLALLRRAQGRYREAEPLLRRSLAIAEKALGRDHPSVAMVTNNLAGSYEEQGRYAEAEPLYRRALGILETALGPDHQEVATNLNNLAGLYRDQGQHARAEPLYKRAIAIRERALGPDHHLTAPALDNLAVLYRNQGRYAEAEPLFKRSIAALAKTLGPDHLAVAGGLDNLGLLYRIQNRHAEAEPLLRRALATREAALGPDHPEVALSLVNLAALQRNERLAEAEALVERALAIWERTLGPGGHHPSTSIALANLAVLRRDQGRLEEAIEAVRKASAVEERRLMQRDVAEVVRSPTSPTRIFEIHAVLGWELAHRDPGRRAQLLHEIFRAGQLAQASDTAAAVARVAARFAAGDDELARLAQERQELAERRRALDAALLTAVSHPPPRRNRDNEERLRRELVEATAGLETRDRQLAERFPTYKELTSPEPVGIDEVQRLLAPDEALLAYAVLGAQGGMDDQEVVFLWFVRRGQAEMYRLDLASGELQDAVRRLRLGLDPGQWAGGVPPRFDTALAHALQRKLLPVEGALLAGVRHLLLVPHGPLESLPFSVLVRSEPRPDAPYRKVDWLARTYATTTLPSVSSLRALRRFAKPSRAAEPFRGVGDPVLRGGPYPRRSIDLPSLFAAGSRGLADPRQVEALPPLPETAGELRTLAASLGADERVLLLREQATEAAVKAGALAGARVVAFATHAGVAGEIAGLAEPALVLTPPAAASEVDDGLLTASEAARLELDADLVLLSACNTAAPDGTPGAAGLSGLAKAFMHAGSRALLVSHWAVLSDAAARLTTGMFAELAREPELGSAEALRHSMLKVLDDEAHPELAHPAAWGPFVLVGGGGPR
jgi:CHAT domain-containing protein/tetratricopeptide (TPR) repeat protein